jgi:hypothetical protein
MDRAVQGAPENPGINMRALKELFQVAEDRGATLKMQARALLLCSALVFKRFVLMTGNEGKARRCGCLWLSMVSFFLFFSVSNNGE